LVSGGEKVEFKKGTVRGMQHKKAVSLCSHYKKFVVVDVADLSKKELNEYLDYEQSVKDEAEAVAADVAKNKEDEEARKAGNQEPINDEGDVGEPESEEEGEEASDGTATGEPEGGGDEGEKEEEVEGGGESELPQDDGSNAEGEPEQEPKPSKEAKKK